MYNYCKLFKMAEILLDLRLKRQTHKDIARAQDIIVKTMYEVYERCVLHGGTAIWRCYKGNRFSEDIDVYINKNPAKIKELFEKLEKKGFVIEKKKIGANSIFSTLKFDRTIVRFEALFKTINASLKDYELCDGNFISVYCLEPEELIVEKINTYNKRLKIRDLYDIYYLLRLVRDKNIILPKLKSLIINFKNPIDESNLKTIILEGITPDTNKILEYIKNWR